jgi:hypothetical protein
VGEGSTLHETEADLGVDLVQPRVVDEGVHLADLVEEHVALLAQLLAHAFG